LLWEETVKWPIHDENNRELANYKVPYGQKILVEEDSKVSAGTKFVNWDPFTNPLFLKNQVR
jgi:DNA-directed RNA polymerase subunit beta'